MSILNLEDVAKKRVAYHGAHEVLLCSLISLYVLAILILNLERLLYADAFQGWHWSRTGANTQCSIMLSGTRLERVSALKVLTLILKVSSVITVSLNKILTKCLNVRILFF